MTEKPGRGWNDPPPLPTGPPAGNAGLGKSSGLKLNKRVPFPLSGPPPSNALPNNLPNMPPKLPVVLPPLGVSAHQDTRLETSEPVLFTPGFNHLSNFQEISKNLTQYLDSATNLEHRSTSEKSLADMEKIWNEGVLDQQICEKIRDISLAVMNKDVETATSLQLEFAAKWPNETSEWASGVLSLVDHLRLSQQKMDLASSEQDTDNKQDNKEDTA